MFCKQVLVWKALSHPNVLPLLGVTMAEDLFTMVSEWMTNGNINEYVKAHLDADRLRLVCFSFGSLSSLRTNV
jgi:serine/threonine protein kinase